MHDDSGDRHVTRLGDHDVYLIDQPMILNGETLDRLSVVLRVLRPVYPPEVLHELVNEAAYRFAGP